MSRDKVVEYLNHGVRDNEIISVLKDICVYRGTEFDANIVNIVMSIPMIGMNVIKSSIDEYLQKMSTEYSVCKLSDKNGNFIMYF